MPRWSWYTGWFNLLGQIGVIASVDYALAIFIAYFIRMFDDGFRLTVLSIYGIFLLVLIAHGLLNTFGVDSSRSSATSACGGTSSALSSSSSSS